MLYLSSPLTVQTIYDDRLAKSGGLDCEGSTMRAIPLGSRNRKEDRIYLELPADFSEKTLSAGPHPELTISLTRAGRYRIERSEEHYTEHIYLILLSVIGKTEDGIGTIRVPKAQERHILRAFSITNRKYRNSHWRVAVIDAAIGDAYLATWTQANSGYSKSRFYYVAAWDNVISCPREKIADTLLQQGLDPSALPFEIQQNILGSRIKRSDWRSL